MANATVMGVTGLLVSAQMGLASVIVTKEVEERFLAV